MRRAVVILLGVVLCPLLVLAQGQTAEVTGTVTDASGAVVANASVTITNASTNVARELKTNVSGIYDAPSLPPGPYTIRVAIAGFQTAVAKLELQVSQIARQDFSLQVGNVAET
ncbi:MAG TPA: carboxypeptidase-like regulatory domain-containing protein, partial [Bryobacteraceae bacterium]